MTAPGPARWFLTLLALISFEGCGGDLVKSPLETEDVPRVDGQQIRFSERYAKRIGLQTTEVVAAGVVPSIAVVGTVTFDPEHVARIGTRLRGLVRDVIHFEGDAVRKGEALAMIDSPELGESQAAVASLKAELEAARQNAARERGLAEAKLTTLRESEHASALTDKFHALLAAAEQKVNALSGSTSPEDPRNIGLHRITSPLDGTIVERHISKGQLEEGDHTAFVVANLDHVWIELAVFEQSLPGICKGDEVDLKPLGSRTPPLKGRVANVGQVLRTATRSAPVRVEVENIARQLRPGQAVDAVIKIAGAVGTQGPVVPPASIILVDGSPSVFIADSATSVRVSPVELGATDGHGVSIRKGVGVGQRVVVEGTFELKSELFR